MLWGYTLMVLKGPMGPNSVLGYICTMLMISIIKGIVRAYVSQVEVQIFFSPTQLVLLKAVRTENQMGNLGNEENYTRNKEA